MQKPCLHQTPIDGHAALCEASGVGPVGYRPAPRNISVPASRPDQVNGLVVLVQSQLERGSGAGQNTVTVVGLSPYKIIGARMWVQSTQTDSGLSTYGAVGIVRCSRFDCSRLLFEVVPLAFQLDVGLTHPAPSCYVCWKKTFILNGSFRLSMKYTARPILWASIESAFPLPYLLTSRAW